MITRLNFFKFRTSRINNEPITDNITRRDPGRISGLASRAPRHPPAERAESGPKRQASQSASRARVRRACRTTLRC
ncbi:unnamed protein product, partial [Iphiclides podalirius]